jgi:hypothetical protein
MPYKPIGILNEHPEWFNPLFSKLDRRGIPYEKLFFRDHSVRGACLYQQAEKGEEKAV